MTAQPYPTYPAYSPYQHTLAAPGPAGSRLDPRVSTTFNSRIRSVSAEGDMEHHRRSSSEERDSLTPAQSRRKAQNRAASVEDFPHRPELVATMGLTSDLVNAPFASAKNVT